MKKVLLLFMFLGGISANAQTSKIKLAQKLKTTKFGKIKNPQL